MDDVILNILLKGEISDPTEKSHTNRNTTKTKSKEAQTLDKTQTKDLSKLFRMVLNGICGENTKQRRKEKLFESRPKRARFDINNEEETITKASGLSHLTTTTATSVEKGKPSATLKHIEPKLVESTKNHRRPGISKKASKFADEAGFTVSKDGEESGAYMRKGADESDVDLKDYVVIEFMNQEEVEEEDETFFDIILSELSLDRDRIADEIRHFIAGAVSACTSVAAAQPFVNLRMKFQALRTPIDQLKTKPDGPVVPRKKLWNQIKIMYAAKGFQVFWKHHKVAQIAGLVQSIALFITYEKVRPMLQLSPIITNFEMCEFVAGATGGVASALVVYPISVGMTLRIARQRALRQLGDNVKNLPNCVGFRGLYRGASPTLFHFGLLYGFKFMFFNNFCDRIITVTDFEDDPLESIKACSAGGAAGLATTTLLHPVNMLRTRLEFTTLQRQHLRFESTCRRFFQCIQMIVRREGLHGLYKGMVPNLLRSVVISAVQFPVYYEVKNWL